MKKTCWLFALLLALFAFGCSGSGDSSLSGTGGGGGTTGGGSAKVPVYVTDAPGTQFQHVWVTLYSIDLVNQSGQSTNVFNSSTGLTLDVCTLRDANGQLFEFIDAAGVPAGTYRSVNITVDNKVVVVKNGQTTSSNLQFFNRNSAGSGRTLLSVNFNPSYTANGSTPLVLDFRIDNWTVDANGMIHATIEVVSENNFNQQRQHERQFEGTVSGLSGTVGNQTFTIQHDRNRSLTVTVNSNTTIFNQNGTANPTLANGQRVQVRGRFVNGTFVANTIQILNGTNNNNEAEATGTFSNLNSTNGTFTLTVQDTEDFAPNSTILKVVTNAATQYFANGINESRADFFADLMAAPANARVQVEGTVGGNTITATTIRLLPSQQEENNQQVLLGGTARNRNSTNGTFTLTVNQWQGRGFAQGQTVNVITNSNTYYNLNGQQSTQAEWFAALTDTSNVHVYGTFSNGTLTAAAVAIGDNFGGHGHGDHDHDHGHGNGNGDGNGNGNGNGE